MVSDNCNEQVFVFFGGTHFVGESMLQSTFSNPQRDRTWTVGNQEMMEEISPITSWKKTRSIVLGRFTESTVVSKHAELIWGHVACWFEDSMKNTSDWVSWQRCLTNFYPSQEVRPQRPNLQLYQAALKSCGDAGRWEDALQLLQVVASVATVAWVMITIRNS